MSAPTHPVHFAERIELSAEADALCRKHGLATYLELAADLAKECFEPMRVSFEFAQDPEFDDQWICMLLDVHGTVESLLAADRKFTSEWVARVPPPERFMIRYSLNVF